MTNITVNTISNTARTAGANTLAMLALRNAKHAKTHEKAGGSCAVGVVFCAGVLQ
jgi:hypothetical protein